MSQQYTPATHTEAVHCQGVLLGVFHPCLWPLKALGSTLGGWSPNLSSARWCQYPLIMSEFNVGDSVFKGSDVPNKKGNTINWQLTSTEWPTGFQFLLNQPIFPQTSLQAGPGPRKASKRRPPQTTEAGLFTGQMPFGWPTNCVRHWMVS